MDEKARGLGIGQALALTLESEFHNWDIKGEYAVVTYSNDINSNQFYKKLGFKFYREFRHHQHIMHEYRKFIPKK